MKQKTAGFKLMLTLVLLIIAILGVTNVAYSYFTSTSTTGANISLNGLSVRFCYFESMGGSLKPTGVTSINLYPASGTIERETPFELSLSPGGEAIYSLNIQNLSGSCEAYIRFWIDAYIEKDGVLDKNINYGKYFFLSEANYYTRTNGSVDGSWCYFFTASMKGSSGSSRTIGNTLVFKDVSETDKVPVELLGETLKISMSLEAVQKDNKAFLSVFGDPADPRGYLKSWT